MIFGSCFWAKLAKQLKINYFSTLASEEKKCGLHCTVANAGDGDDVVIMEEMGTKVQFH